MGNKDKTPSHITIIRTTFQKDCRRRLLTLKKKWAMFWSIRSITRSSPKSLYSGCNHCPKLSISCCPRSNPLGQAPGLTELTSYLSGISPPVSLTGWSGARMTFLEHSPPWQYISRPSLWSGLLTQARPALNPCSSPPALWPLFSGFCPLATLRSSFLLL